ncbi:hypothetical protein BJ508DRAFT_322134 [Ascobolus immersus RN42]|uniref:Uncharacterized protein n=1 Tax=Ascobolus immersus RN42 TaxID=1160509 RepID=A0A3N4IIM5_ASCIM|nr:hypothetical protein BJ508DRAFT_322134 [Ascobolus immersus RN42]
MSYYLARARQLLFASSSSDARFQTGPSIPTSTSSSSFYRTGRYEHDKYSLHPDTVVGLETYRRYASHTYELALNGAIGKGEWLRGRGFCLLGLVDELKSKEAVSPKFGRNGREYLDADGLNTELTHLGDLIHQMKTVLRLWRVDPVTDHKKYSQAVDELDATKHKENLEFYIRNFLRWHRRHAKDDDDGIIDKEDDDSWEFQPGLGPDEQLDGSWADIAGPEIPKEKTSCPDELVNTSIDVDPDEHAPKATSNIGEPPTLLVASTIDTAHSTFLFTDVRAPKNSFSSKKSRKAGVSYPIPENSVAGQPHAKDNQQNQSFRQTNCPRHSTDRNRLVIPPLYEHLEGSISDLNLSDNFQAGGKRDYTEAFESGNTKCADNEEQYLYGTSLPESYWEPRPRADTA